VCLLRPALEKKAEWLQRYLKALPEWLPEETKMLTQDQMRALASSIMDANMFAGGQSVPSVIAVGLALPYSRWGRENLPSEVSLDDVSTIPAYTFEVMRRFPMVSGFSWIERSFGNTPAQHNFVNLHMALHDPRVWGADAGKFRLRPLSEYHKLGIGFAEPAVYPHNRSSNSRACPAKDLAFALITSFLREFIRSVCGAQGGHKAHWLLQTVDGKGDVALSMNGAGTFELHRNAATILPPVSRHGQEILQKLTPEERKELNEVLEHDSKFKLVDRNTRWFLKTVAVLVDPTKQRSSLEIKPDAIEKHIFEKWSGPLGGIKFIMDDEDKEQPGAIKALLKFLFFSTTQTFELDETASQLVWFENDQEATVTMETTVGRYLPAQFNTWDNLTTDEGTAVFCISGLGAMYLQAVTPASDAGHVVPEGAAMEVNLEYLYQYETRATWIRYGHTAYLSAPAREDAVTACSLIAIWCCQQQRLVRPGDDLWEHAKLAFRSSVGFSVTAKDHLMQLHWMRANGLHTSARETLSVDHPLRRLLKQYYYGTASINMSSKDMLMPLHQFAHRTFALSDEGWLSYFSDLFKHWKYETFPDSIAKRGLPEKFVKQWPVAVEGLALWHTFEAHVSDYLKIFYEGPDLDAAVNADADIVAFWNHFETDSISNAPWQLPTLTFSALVHLLTDLVWWVTAGHEFVGSIVECITPPRGLPAKVIDGQTDVDAQSYAQALVIIALTGIRQPPLMGDWTHIFHVASWPPGKAQGALDAVRNLQSELAKCADAMDDRNANRERNGERKFMAFNPRILETSVSI